MFSIQSIPVSAETAIDVYQVSQSSNEMLISLGKESGNLLLPEWNPRNVQYWSGFQIMPQERGVEISLISVLTGQTYWFDGASWVAIGTSNQLALPNFRNNADQIREGLKDWVGPVKFRLFLTRSNQGASPRISEVKVGCVIPLQFLDYVARFVIPQLLESQLVDLTRWEVPSTDGSTMAIASDFEPQRIEKVSVYRTQRRPQEGTVNTAGLKPLIQLPIPIPGTEPAMVVYTYRVKTEYHPGFYQVTDVPCIRLDLLPAENRVKLYDNDFIQVNPDTIQLWHPVYQVNRPMEATVVASSRQEAQTIAQAMISRLSKNGAVEVPAFGDWIHLYPYDGIEDMSSSEDSDQLERSSLNSVRFKIMLVGVLEGEVLDQQTFPSIEDLILEAEASRQLEEWG